MRKFFLSKIFLRLGVLLWGSTLFLYAAVVEEVSPFPSGMQTVPSTKESLQKESQDLTHKINKIKATNRAHYDSMFRIIPSHLTKEVDWGHGIKSQIKQSVISSCVQRIKLEGVEPGCLGTVGSRGEVPEETPSVDDTTQSTNTVASQPNSVSQGDKGKEYYENKKQDFEKKLKEVEDAHLNYLEKLSKEIIFYIPVEEGNPEKIFKVRKFLDYETSTLNVVAEFSLKRFVKEYESLSQEIRGIKDLFTKHYDDVYSMIPLYITQTEIPERKNWKETNSVTKQVLILAWLGAIKSPMWIDLDKLEENRKEGLALETESSGDVPVASSDTEEHHSELSPSEKKEEARPVEKKIVPEELIKEIKMNCTSYLEKLSEVIKFCYKDEEEQLQDYKLPEWNPEGIDFVGLIETANFSVKRFIEKEIEGVRTKRAAEIHLQQELAKLAYTKLEAAQKKKPSGAESPESFLDESVNDASTAVGNYVSPQQEKFKRQQEEPVAREQTLKDEAQALKDQAQALEAREKALKDQEKALEVRENALKDQAWLNTANAPQLVPPVQPTSLPVEKNKGCCVIS